jgi:hypothetical protein
MEDIELLLIIFDKIYDIFSYLMDGMMESTKEEINIELGKLYTIYEEEEEEEEYKLPKEDTIVTDEDFILV